MARPSSASANNYGTVFSLPVTGGNPTVLASFNNSSGACPLAGLTLGGNTLYGTTYSGSANGDGAVFSLPVSGGIPTLLASFDGSNGENPAAELTLIGNTLYGTAGIGGAYNCGTVFSVPASGGSLTVLASLGGAAAYPSSGLTHIGDTLYGTTSGTGHGTVFSVPVTGGGFKVLATFNGSNGDGPEGDLTPIGNTLYGATWQGGAYGYGTVFTVPVGGGTPTTVLSFAGGNGANPNAGYTAVGNTLYGTAAGGGEWNQGTVFALNIAPATVALGSTRNATIITGGTATLGATLSNLPSSANSVNYTVAAAVQSGNAVLGSVTSGTGTLRQRKRVLHGLGDLNDAGQQHDLIRCKRADHAYWHPDHHGHLDRARPCRGRLCQRERHAESGLRHAARRQRHPGPPVPNSELAGGLPRRTGPRFRARAL